MPGFDFRYRLSGGAPTVESLPFTSARPLSAGDMVKFDAGEVVPAGTGDRDLLGVALETSAGTVQPGKLNVITDSDAVYAVTNGHARVTNGTVDLIGATGDQGIGSGPNGDLALVPSEDTGETLVRINAGKHWGDVLTGGELNAAIARAVVRIHRDYVGRGPTKAQAFFRGNVVVVVLQDVMTTAEKTLVADGQSEAVLKLRHSFQIAMRGELSDAVERLTGCKVDAFMNDNHIDPDIAAQVYVLDRPVPA
jgi:uncharacterized protein YbcI